MRVSGCILVSFVRRLESRETYAVVTDEIRGEADERRLLRVVVDGEDEVLRGGEVGHVVEGHHAEGEGYGILVSGGMRNLIRLSNGEEAEVAMEGDFSTVEGLLLAAQST